MACTSAINDPDFNGDRDHDEWTARVDAGELCPECGSVDTFSTTTGPRFKIPLFECRACHTTWFDCVTRPTVDDRTIDMFGAA